MSAESPDRQRQEDLRTRNAIVSSTDRSLLVEAAAGTGKTTLLVARALHGIRAGAFRAPEMVAITFTEKAAAELEARLRARLTEALHTPDLPADERDRVRAATAEIDQAHISTIHSFCAALLRERPVEAGVDPEFEVLDQTQAELLRRQCWEAWIAEQVQSREAPVLEVLLSGATGGVEEPLKRLADALAASPETLDPSLFTLERPPLSIEELGTHLLEQARRAAPLFANPPGRTNAHYRLMARLIPILAGGTQDSVELHAAAAVLAGVDLDTALKSFGKRKEEARPLLSPLAETARSVAAHLACGLFEWMAGFVRYYGEEKRRRSAVDFQDLLLLAARMVRRNKPVRRYFQKRFRAFFVDEFQDTDPLQAEVVALLCERPRKNPAETLQEVDIEEGKLFVVGDPKQSIYRFRRADVLVYEQVKGLFGGRASEARSVLAVAQNFRSTSCLIDVLNSLFERILSPLDQEGVYQARHVPLVCASEDRPGGAAVIAVYPPSDLGTAELGAADARALEARYLAHVLKDLVEGNAPQPVATALGGEAPSYGSFALLFRALTDVGLYEDALEALGVPYRVLGGKSFYRREEVGETLSVLKAVDDPLDEVSVVAALRSSYFGLSDEDLFRFREAGGSWHYLTNEAHEGPVGEAMALLAEWHDVRNRAAPQELLRKILDRTKALEAFGLKPAGRQRAANVQKVLGQLRALWRASHGTFRSIVDHLTGLQERQVAEEESSIVEPGDDFVLLLSIHKAKGLEFDGVALPDLSREFPKERGPLFVDRINRKIALGLGDVRSLHFDALSAAEQQNVLAEQKRLLYVASTRARKLLVLPMFWQKRRGACMLDFLTEGELFAAPEQAPYGEARDGIFYWDTPALSKSVRLEARPRPAVAAAGRASAAGMLAQRDRWLRQHSEAVGRAARGVRVALPSSFVGAAPAQPEGAPGQPGGRQFGTLFHNVMARMPLADLAAQPDMAGLARGLAGIEAAPLGLDEDAAVEAAELAAETCRNPDFVRLLTEAEAVRQEAAFAVPLRSLPAWEGQDGLLEGSIDLLLAGGGGAVVLDYKTDPARAPDETAGSYWPQLALYGLAAQACGWALGPVELVLFLVRGPHLLRRALDAELLQEARARLAVWIASEGLT